MMKRILIATGGTGGHIYPALVTAQELRRRGWDVLFVGSFGTAVSILTAERFAVRELQVKGFVSKSPLQVVLAGVLMLKAFAQCLGVIRQFRPDVVLGFGGYSSFAAVLSAVAVRVPAMIHEQNACPGEANRFLGAWVRKVALSFNDGATAFPKGRTILTGCPMRPLSGTISRQEALRVFGLREDRRTILVFGGSQGSRAINRAFVTFLEQASPASALQVIHLTGKGASEGLLSVYARLGIPFFVRDYYDNMAGAYAAADVVVARSGAGTVTELGILGIPGVLIPYPHARSHQTANADVLERRGAAVIIQEKDLNPLLLGDKIFTMLSSPLSKDDRRRLLGGEIFSDAVQRLADEVETC